MKKPSNIATLTGEELNELTERLCSTYSGWFRAVAKYPGILTHQLPDLLKPSNNPAAISRMLNKKLLPYDLRIEKAVITKPSESWGWFLVRISSGVEAA